MVKRSVGLPWWAWTVIAFVVLVVILLVVG